MVETPKIEWTMSQGKWFTIRIAEDSPLTLAASAHTAKTDAAGPKQSQ